MVATAQSNSKLMQFTDEADMYGNSLTIGCEVLFAIGSKIRSGTIIRPTPVTIVEKGDNEGGESDDVIEVTETVVRGVLIYNDESANRKMVTRPCADVCILA